MGKWWLTGGLMGFSMFLAKMLQNIQFWDWWDFGLIVPPRQKEKAPERIDQILQQGFVSGIFYYIRKGFTMIRCFPQWVMLFTPGEIVHLFIDSDTQASSGSGSFPNKNGWRFEYWTIHLMKMISMYGHSPYVLNVPSIMSLGIGQKSGQNSRPTKTRRCYSTFRY